MQESGLHKNLGQKGGFCAKPDRHLIDNLREAVGLHKIEPEEVILNERDGRRKHGNDLVNDFCIDCINEKVNQDTQPTAVRSAKNTHKVQAGEIDSGTIYELSFVTRDLGSGSESNTFRAYWTGAVDTWGKLTIYDIDTQTPSYLFHDEIKELTPIT